MVDLVLLQVEVSSGKYIAHVASKQQEVAASQDMENAAPPHEQLMSELSELDKLGQEGAAPVDDAEVTLLTDCLGLSRHVLKAFAEGLESCTRKRCVCLCLVCSCLPVSMQAYAA